jgi:iron complex outermembrane recepter protein
MYIYQYRLANSLLYGGEAGFHFHPSFAEWLHFETNFSHVTGKQRNGEYLPFIPASKLQAEIRAEKEKLWLLHEAYIGFSTETAFDQNHPAPDETATSGYTLLNMSIGAKIKTGKQYAFVSFGVNNLLDKKYIDHLSTLKEVSYFNPGRNITMSLRIPFGCELINNKEQ